MRTDLKPALLACGVALVLSAGTARPQDPAFNPGCTLPFGSVAPAADSFASCGNCGVVSGAASAAEAAAKAAESKAKNNLCGNLAAKTVVDFSILRNMQALPINKNNLGDRHTLRQIFTVGNQKIGEGSVVRLKAFVKEAHISDCDGGEEVNCKKTGPQVNDIHIPLVDPSQPNPSAQDECTSVTAEMIPHFRPAAWAQLDMKTPVKNPVRVTGQLFFDNSHDPCVKNPDGTFKRNSPPRSSLWEIHPVYQFEVCAKTDPQQCDVANDSVWIPYDRWVALPGSVTQPTGQHDRQECEALHGTPSKPVKATKPGRCAAPGKSPAKGKGKTKTPKTHPS